ncbi:unnamed protein product [Rodentolepis nana]|uniref:non-specific serine/threonine protein kinase n=1 Tax=Rodentolepis nana TaxID=102285 RepID=A0A0R3TDU3_RODNA|nr:unnamed protein product [Rodentolepis nana]
MSSSTATRPNTRDSEQRDIHFILKVWSLGSVDNRDDVIHKSPGSGVVNQMDIIETTVERIISKKGAVSQVYKAHDKRRGIDLAIKKIHHDDCKKKSLEVKILESLRGCPNIIQLLGSIDARFVEPLLFYRAKDRVGQLAAIIKIVGIESIMNYVQLNNIRIDTKLEAQISLYDREYHQCANDAYKEADDLMCKLMTVDPFRRITARQVFSHPFLKKFHYDEEVDARLASKFNADCSLSMNKLDNNLAHFDCKFVACVGEGSFGQVHRVRTDTEWKTLAVKIMKQNNLSKFHQECEILEKLRDAPNVIKFFGTVTGVSSI